MKVLILVLLACAIYSIAVTIAFRTMSDGSRAGLMVRAYLSSLPVLYFVYKLTPADLGFLPALPDAELADYFIFVFFPYTAAVFGGILQLYNLADRGFSLRILIDILESSQGVLRTEDVARQYSDGKGIDWMIQKRFDGLTEQNMIRIEGDRAYLTSRGRFFGSVYMYLRQALGLPLQAGTSR